MLARSRCVSGCVGLTIAARSSSSAVIATGITHIAVSGADRRPDANNGERLTAATSKARKASSTIETASDCIASDASSPPNHQTTF